MALLEICADGVASALAAEKAGAHRIELCVSLESGGLTPSAAMLAFVRRQINIPVHVLVRPRRGNFIYSSQEATIMLSDINTIRDLGFEGVVVGTLDKQGKLDQALMHDLMQAAAEMSVTFHRAIDVADQPFILIEKLIQLGVGRLLTSGGYPTALEGSAQIAAYQQAFGSHISIMAGSGVHSSNVRQLINTTGITEVHASAKSKQITEVQHQIHPVLAEDHWTFEPDPEEVKALLSALL